MCPHQPQAGLCVGRRAQMTHIVTQNEALIHANKKPSPFPWQPSVVYPRVTWFEAVPHTCSPFLLYLCVLISRVLEGMFQALTFAQR
mmetsp:Transcript_6368/g.11771  ORF Transcript_6368/g.11771 Transcript_6368/m.11771 type:complete len:87 (-) Transcript_6368:116-376(-)